MEEYMRRILFLFLAAFVLTAAATANAQEAEEDKSLSVPKAVVVPQGGRGYLSVKVDRDVFKNKVEIAVTGLPPGMTVDGKSKVELSAAADNAWEFKLLAATDLAEKDYNIRVAASDADKTITKDKIVPVTVQNFDVRGYGVLIMVISVASVLLLVSFCMYRVLMLPPTEEETLKGPLEIDTRSAETRTSAQTTPALPRAGRRCTAPPPPSRRSAPPPRPPAAPIRRW
jgi:hypothetical protein